MTIKIKKHFAKQKPINRVINLDFIFCSLFRKYYFNVILPNILKYIKKKIIIIFVFVGECINYWMLFAKQYWNNLEQSRIAKEIKRKNYSYIEKNLKNVRFMYEKKKKNK